MQKSMSPLPHFSIFPIASLEHWALTCEALGATTKKLEKRAILATYLAPLQTADSAQAALYVAGQPFAEVDRRQLGVGSAMLMRIAAVRTGAAPADLILAVRRSGDIGTALEALVREALASESAMNLTDLASLLAAVAAGRGPKTKQVLITVFLQQCSARVCKYTLKLLSGDMRIGVKQSLVEEAVAVAYQRDLAAVRHASMLLGSLPAVVTHAAADTLSEAAMRLFHPLGFMLASPVDSVEQAMARFTAASPVDQLATPGNTWNQEAPLVELREAQLEDKYDGIRAQLHAGDPTFPGAVGLFSRGREDLAAAFPELVEAFSGLRDPVILDGEILAWHPAAKVASASATISVQKAQLSLDPFAAKALPFSALQQRLGRKLVSQALRQSHPVVFMAFDLLYADGKLWLEQPLVERRARLERYVSEHAFLTLPAKPAAASQQLLFAAEQVEPNGAQADGNEEFARLLVASAIRMQSAAQLDAAYNEARARGNEGVMLKAADSVYQPGRRGMAWLKLKRELATLDVVVTGAEFGSGRRAGYLSDYTFAVRDEQGDFKNIGKAYAGLTDAEMHALSAHFMAHTLVDFGHFRTVDPDTILEVAFNNITRSDRHESGYALRFPRILRIRTEPGKPEKPLTEIDTLARVGQLYDQQPDKPREPAEEKEAGTAPADHQS
jgi:DNA ligase-1